VIDRAAARLKSGVSVREMGPYVGATGFEPAASRSQSGRSTKLSYAPGGLARMCVLIGPKKSSRRARTPLPASIRRRDQENRLIQDENGQIPPDLVESPELGNGWVVLRTALLAPNEEKSRNEDDCRAKHPRFHILPLLATPTR
jgi:hypothetical protein